ncbi:hypothetical protein DdX_21264 [Ditylenchus destructor]|uniref:Uncharacterized protein n=1 Tax=Ditylenchus destructor TaxID=166010 RepID=A0AAD4QRG4_9BILA|nr:hypothetical protein DdX_21264 [Ditylenchus destructor]
MDLLFLDVIRKRFADIFFKRRRIFPWEMEVKDLILRFTTGFLLEIFVVKVIMGLFRNQKAESLWWLIFIVCTIPTLKLFPELPLG